MRIILFFTIYLLSIISCFAQTDINMIGHEISYTAPKEIILYDSSEKKILKGLGGIRLRFDKDMKIIEFNLVYLLVRDSLTNKKIIEYLKSAQKLVGNKNKLSFYQNNLDSVFRKINYKIIESNNTFFTPKLHFTFKFYVYPKI